MLTESKNKIKVSFLISGFGAGGRERQLYYLINALKKSCSVQLFIFSEDLFFAETLDDITDLNQHSSVSLFLNMALVKHLA